MPYFDTHFTLEEANAKIQWIQTIFSQIHDLLYNTQTVSNVIQLKPDASHFSSNGKSNGHHKQSAPQISKQDVMNQINALIAEITDAGIVIQDVQRGLIDFPGYIDGEEVFLCYELEDGDEIKYWHSLNSGYGGRTPIEGT